MATSTFRNKNLVRPKKAIGMRRKRIKNHTKRVIDLGYTPEQVRRMNPVEMRKILRHPVQMAVKTVAAD